MNTLHLPTHKRLAVVAILPLLGLGLAACGGGNTSSSGSTSSGSTTSGSASSAYGGGSSAGGTTAGAKTVNVTETEYKIALSQSTLTPGTYTFKVADKGQVTHALEIDGPGVSDVKSSPASPGGSTSLTVTLKKGTYEVYCPVDGHKGLGMDTKITVR